MRRALGLVLAIPLFTLGCGDDTGTTPMPDAPMADARVDAPRIDAPTPDAPSVDADNTTPTTPHTVQCSLGGGATCDTNNQYCCVTIGGGLPTFDCTNNNVDAGCSADQHCDGTEDCTGSQICCGSGTAGAAHSECKGACDNGETQLCHNHTQCPASASSCCTATVMGFMLPFGGCFAPGSEPQGAMCDTP